MKKEMIKALLYYLGSVLLALDLMFNDLIIYLQITLLWAIAYNILWGAGIFIYFTYLKIYWGISKEDVEPAPIPPIILESRGTATYTEE